MAARSLIEGVLRNSEGLLVRQSARSSVEDCLMCQAVSEFRIGELKRQQVEGSKLLAATVGESPDIMYTVEASGACERCCCREGRGMEMTVIPAGGKARGPPILKFTKSKGCPAHVTVPTLVGGIELPCCCCMLPEVTATDPGGEELAKAKYVVGCTPCVPKVEYSEHGKPVYLLRPQTCCWGNCVAWSGCMEERAMFPFYFHDPEDGLMRGSYGGPETPQIRKLHTGQKMCCFSEDTFAIFYPKGIDAQRKGGLLALAFLLEMTVFERQP